AAKCSHFFSHASIALYLSRVHDLSIHAFDLIRINSPFVPKMPYRFMVVCSLIPISAVLGFCLVLMIGEAAAG
ncbi:MAG: hypothetical protein KZQ80_02035, partial [Candidatus Thiodiazotropha sp. (ex Monitilora ramsayi)]|nr:hypothetical protein [Candidatus Thiodiazotropha sp. (ex Monitilora ramsayi)]